MKFTHILIRYLLNIFSTLKIFFMNVLCVSECHNCTGTVINKHCYSFHGYDKTVWKTYNNAENECQKNSEALAGHLVYIETDAEWKALKCEYSMGF